MQDEKELSLVRQFLMSQGLHYPNYARWVDEVCIPDIQSNWKEAIFAYSNGHIVGDIIYQPHKELPRTREFKNMRIHPLYRGRHLASFLLRQAEVDGDDFDRIILDVNTKQKPVIELLLKSGYRAISETPLYRGDEVDVIMQKELRRSA